MSLEKFQRATVEHILRVLRGKRRRVFALADEVGLGKTRVVADVIAQRLTGVSNTRDVFVFYVAPSHALLKQNLKRMRHLIDDRFAKSGVRRTVLAYDSRISELRLDADDERHHTRGRCVHLVGLTADTSFKLGGTGTRKERALLCAIVLRGRQLVHTSRAGVLRNLDPHATFYLLKSKKNYPAWKKTVRTYRKNKSKMIDEICRRIDFAALDENLIKLRTKKNLDALCVRHVRRCVTEAVLKTLSISDIVLDEWHRYSTLCIQEQYGARIKPRQRANAAILPALLSEVRDGRRADSSALLVSATPCVIRFETSDGPRELQTLCRIVYGQEEGDRRFGEVNRLQQEFQRRLTNASQHREDALWTAAREAGQDLQAKLKHMMVRTQRPALLDAGRANTTASAVDCWSQIDLLAQTAAPDVSSPLPALCSDSRTFVKSREYKSIFNHWRKNIPVRLQRHLLKTQHWKVGIVQKSIDAALKPPARGVKKTKQTMFAPLWLSPCDDTGRKTFGKMLIFSDFRHTPREAVENLHVGERIGPSHLFSGSVFGHFPGRGRSRSVKVSPLWVHFMPWVAMETSDQDAVRAAFKRLLRKAVHSARRCRDEKTCAIETLIIALDCYLLRTLKQPSRQTREARLGQVANRAKLLGADLQQAQEMTGEQLSAQLGQHRGAGIEQLAERDAPGVVFARACRRVRERIQQPSSESVESAFLLGAETVLRLFSSPDAQHLSVKAFGLGHANMTFVRKYIAAHRLGDTLEEYFDLLADDERGGQHPIESIMQEFNDVVTMPSTRHGRYVRAYTEDVDDRGNTNPVDSNALRKAFNSPFAPYMLVTTSVGQEGIDLHRYCRKIVHWSTPHCPSVLQQREGRLDRYKSLQVREACRRAKRDGIPVSRSGMSPNFVVLDDAGKRLNSLERYVLYLPFSQQEKRWERCLVREYLTGVLIGAPDPAAVEQRFAEIRRRCDEETWKSIARGLQTCSLSLEP